MGNSGSQLRETLALDPETKRPCQARVVERDGKIYLEKTLTSGQTRVVMAESDAAFYKRFAYVGLAGKHIIMNHFFYVTSRCNLKCPVCYEGTRDREEPSLAFLKHELEKLRRVRVLVCGAEPTCRGDLPELIRAVNRRNTAVLMTNGIRMADMRYVRLLKEAGLKFVILAMNGMTDDVYRRINGEALLDIKLKALENMEEAGFTIYLSMTVTRGINEDQVKPLLDLESRMKNVVQVRFRSMAEMGHYIEGGQFFMSELVKLVCYQAGIDYEMWCRQQDFLDHLGRIVKNDHIRPRLCAMRAELDKNLVPFAADRDWEEWNRTAMKKPRLLVDLARYWGLGYLFRFALDSMGGGFPYTRHPRFRRISVRVWPNLETMDLDLNSRCSSLYLRDGDKLPFCLSNCLRNP